MSSDIESRQLQIIMLRKFLLDCFERMNYSKPEPNIVADMVKQIPMAVNKESFRHCIKIQAGAVFVHQQPQVTCKGFVNKNGEIDGENSVEIGDLLLLRKEGKYPFQQTRALLLQVKKCEYEKKYYAPDNKNQHTLYNTWPEFEYTRSTAALNGQSRHITSKDIYTGAKYLLLPKHNSPEPHYNCYYGCHCDCGCCFPFHCKYEIKTAMPTTPHLSFYRCFIDELVQFIFGYAGKFYRKPGEDEIGWHRVINDLTEITAKQISKYTDGARGIYIYGDPYSLSFINSDIASKIREMQEGVETVNETNDKTDDKESSGMSIIEFTISQE